MAGYVPSALEWVSEVTADPERQCLWDAAAKAYPPYNEYQPRHRERFRSFSPSWPEVSPTRVGI